MITLTALADKNARPFLLYSIFIGLVWLIAINYVFNIISLYSQNARDAEVLIHLTQKLSEAPPKSILDPQVYIIRDANQSLSAATLQKTMSMIASDLDVTIRSFETIAPRPEDPTGRLAAEFQFELDERKLALFLHRIENFKPAIIFEHISLQATKGRDTVTTNRLQGTGIVVSAWQASP